MEFYLVKNKWRNQEFVHETDTKTASFKSTVGLMATGEFDTGEVIAVYRCRPDVGIMEDVTKEILVAVGEYLEDRQEQPVGEVAALLWKNGIEVRKAPLMIDEEHRLGRFDLLGRA